MPLVWSVDLAYVKTMALNLDANLQNGDAEIEDGGVNVRSTIIVNRRGAF